MTAQLTQIIFFTSNVPGLVQCWLTASEWGIKWRRRRIVPTPPLNLCKEVSSHGILFETGPLLAAERDPAAPSGAEV